MDINKLVTVSHDPFGRFEIVRQLVEKEDRGYCAWCGQPAKFNYGVWHDGVASKPEMDEHQFCSIGCRNSYMG